MSSDPVCAFVLLGMGLDELSTSPYAVPEIKEMVRSASYAEARRLAEDALAIERPEEIRQRAMEIIGRESPELPL
jgi:signal transduction protein with GAF and PtsI domain